MSVKRDMEQMNLEETAEVLSDRLRTLIERVAAGEPDPFIVSTMWEPSAITGGRYAIRATTCLACRATVYDTPDHPCRQPDSKYPIPEPVLIHNPQCPAEVKV